MGFCFSKPSNISISSASSSSDDSSRHHYRPIPITSSKESLDIPSPPPPPPISAPKPPAPPQIGTILGRLLIEITSIYDIGKELGRGQFGITYICTEKSTGLKYACKSISKRKLQTAKDIEDVKREILILEHLTGQPNIVEFKGAYEDKQNLHLVMELCSGGELFDRITAKGSYSEREAAALCRQIVTVVHVCHFMGVMHRDLKPENFLLVSKDEDSPLKATDFGLSVFIEENEGQLWFLSFVILYELVFYFDNSIYLTNTVLVIFLEHLL